MQHAVSWRMPSAWTTLKAGSYSWIRQGLLGLYTAAVPAQLIIRPSPIPGAGLGLFAITFISKGVQLKPYQVETVDKDDMGGLHKTINAREVRNGVFLCIESENLYVICEK